MGEAGRALKGGDPGLGAERQAFVPGRREGGWIEAAAPLAAALRVEHQRNPANIDRKSCRLSPSNASARHIVGRQQRRYGIVIEADRSGGAPRTRAQIAAQAAGRVYDPSAGGREAPCPPCRDGGMGHHL